VALVRFSGRWKKVEQNYSIPVKEAAALIKALRFVQVCGACDRSQSSRDTRPITARISAEISESFQKGQLVLSERADSSIGKSILSSPILLVCSGLIKKCRLVWEFRLDPAWICVSNLVLSRILDLIWI
jgi:hypothetical protein